MTIHYSQWYIFSNNNIPEWFKLAITNITGKENIDNLAKLLWGRGIRDVDVLCNMLCHPPQSISEDNNIETLVSRLFKAWQEGEKVVIVSDDSLNGVITTSLLMQGLQPYFLGENSLSCYLWQSQNFNQEDIDKLKDDTNLIIFPHFNSENQEVINQIFSLNIDTIIIDRYHNFNHKNKHIFPVINFSFPILINAYQLVKSFINKFPLEKNKVTQNIIKEKLLSIVALGILATQTKVTGESRLLFRQGMNLLKRKSIPLINLLSSISIDNNNEPMDYIHGLGYLIKFIYTQFSEEYLLLKLLTTNVDKERFKLIDRVQQQYQIFVKFKNTIIKEIDEKLQKFDLFHHSIIILENSQWTSSFLSFIPELICQKYGKPTILLSRDSNFILSGYGYSMPKARCAHDEINLWELLLNQQDLLIKLTKNNDRIELSLSFDNLSLIKDNLNQQIKAKYFHSYQKKINIDFLITLDKLTLLLAEELFLLAPFTIDNPRPKFLIQNVWFSNIYDKYNYDTDYNICHLKMNDDTLKEGKNALWKGHRKKEINSQWRYDTIVELDYDSDNQKYSLNIIELKKVDQENRLIHYKYSPLIIDKRQDIIELNNINQESITINKCPLTWEDLRDKSSEAINDNKDLILAYRHEEELKIEEKWSHLLTIIKQGVNNHHHIPIKEVLMILNISENSLDIILNSLNKIGISYEKQNNDIKFIRKEATFLPENYLYLKNFFQEVIYQENLQKTYFYQVPIKTIENIIFS